MRTSVYVIPTCKLGLVHHADVSLFTPRSSYVQTCSNSLYHTRIHSHTYVLFLSSPPVHKKITLTGIRKNNSRIRMVFFSPSKKLYPKSLLLFLRIAQCVIEIRLFVFKKPCCLQVRPRNYTWKMEMRNWWYVQQPNIPWIRTPSLPVCLPNTNKLPTPTNRFKKPRFGW